VYLIFFIIDFSPLSPITGPDDPNRAASKCESNRQYSLAGSPHAIISLFDTAMFQVTRDDSLGIEKRLLGQCEGDAMLTPVLNILSFIPLKCYFGHPIRLFI
jgi:hypothetical protein